MKPLRLILYALLIVLAVSLWLSARPWAAPDRPEESAAIPSLETVDPVDVPMLPTLESRPAEVPVAELEPQQPVQSLEERGDAMLFEAGALQGTPFDRAVVMPFE